MDNRLQLSFSDEIHVADSLLREFKSSPEVDSIRSEFYKLKTELWGKSISKQRAETILDPFFMIINLHGIQEQTMITVMNCIHRLVQNGFCSQREKGDFLVECLIETQGKMPSSLQNTFIINSFQIIYSVCSVGSITAKVALNALKCLMRDHPNMKNSMSSPFFLVVIAKTIAFAAIDEAQSLFTYLMHGARREASSRRSLSANLLLILAEANQESINYLRPTACSLLLDALSSHDQPCGFVSIMRLFFVVFSKCWSENLYMFTPCFSAAIKYVNSQAKSDLRADVFEMIVDFIAIPNFMKCFFANFNERDSLEPLVDPLLDTISKVAGIESDLQFSRPLAIGIMTTIVNQLSNIRQKSIPAFNLIDLEEHTENSAEKERRNFKSAFEANPAKYHVTEKNKDYVATMILASDVSPDASGIFFGRNEDIVLSVLDKYLNLIDFHDMSLDNSIRVFLTAIHLPGEGQVVDRVFDHFAKIIYTSQGPNKVFSSAESVHILLYAWMMLHTSLHNASVTNKQTEQTFKQMLEGQNDGGNFDDKFIHELFMSVQLNEVPLSLEDRILTSYYWILQGARGKVINLKVKTGHECGVTAALFERIWKAAGHVFSELFESGNKGALTSFEGSIMIASKYHETQIVNNVLKTFCAFATSSLNKEEGARSLEFVFRIAMTYGSDISDWNPFVDVLVYLFQKGALNDSFLTEENIENEQNTIVFSFEMFAKAALVKRYRTRSYSTVTIGSPFPSLASRIISFIKPETLPLASKDFTTESVVALLEAIHQKALKYIDGRRGSLAIISFLVHFASLIIEGNGVERAEKIEAFRIVELINSLTLPKISGDFLEVILNSVFRLLKTIPAKIIFKRKFIDNILTDNESLAEVSSTTNACIRLYLSNNPPSRDLFKLIACASNLDILWETYLLLEKEVGPDFHTCCLLAAGSDKTEERIDKLQGIIESMRPNEAAHSCIEHLIPSLMYVTPFSKPFLVHISLYIITMYPREIVKVHAYDESWIQLLKFVSKEKVGVEEMIQTAECLMKVVKGNRELIKQTKTYIEALDGHLDSVPEGDEDQITKRNHKRRLSQSLFFVVNKVISKI